MLKHGKTLNYIMYTTLNIINRITDYFIDSIYQLFYSLDAKGRQSRHNKIKWRKHKEKVWEKLCKTLRKNVKKDY